MPGIDRPTAYGIEPSRAEIDASSGPLLVEFGADWCGFCQALQPDLAKVLARYPQVRHIKVADGRGQPLGRSFRVKLWPSLVFLRDGQPLKHLARPTIEEVEEGFELITTAP